MNLSSGLKYKPAINRDIEPLLAKGLVHMFEFKKDIEFKKDLDKYLSNFCNALAGKDTGPYSSFQDLEKDSFSHLGFNEKKQLFQALPGTAIGKNDNFLYPIALYNLFNNVGFIIDPSQVDFVIVEPSHCNNSPHQNNRIKFIALPTCDTDHFNKINIGSEGRVLDALFKTYTVPMHRSEEDKINIRKLFDKDLWSLYSKDYPADSPEFKEHFINLRNKSWKNSVSPLMSEIIFNCPPTAIKGIVLYSTDKASPLTYAAPTFEKNRISGTMFAVLTKLAVKKTTGTDLPIIHYQCPVKDLDILEPATAKEVKVEMDKVRTILKTNRQNKKTFESVLGEQYVQNLVLGKEDFGPE